MEEKENTVPLCGDTPAAGDGAACSPSEAAPVTEDAAAAEPQQAVTQEQAPSDGQTQAPSDGPQQSDAEASSDGQLSCPTVAPDWRFGEEPVAPTAQRGGTKRFFAIFGSAFAICLALLIVVLLVGDAGIKIYRIVTNERTVFVHEYDNGENGLLAPAEAADLIKKSTVTVSVRTKTGSGIGSGFIYTPDGYICTNHHVIEDAVSVQVVMPGGEAVDATVVGSDEMSDLAVLKIDRTGLVPVKLGNSDAALVGESVVAVGTPAKLDYAGTSTFGRISATNRIVALTDDSGVVSKKMTLIQTDASVNPGNSGGPLANMYGEVIGIVVMKVSYFGGTAFDGIGFAIPVNGAKTVIDAIIKDGSFTGENPVATGRCLIGISGRGLPGGYWYSDPASDAYVKSETEQLGYTYMPCDGVYVIAVNGANAAGKLREGDVITAINGLHMYTVYDVINQVNRYPVNQAVTVTVMRQNGSEYEELQVDIVLLEEQ